MQELQFTWDAAKERANRSKHGITFDEAQTVFFDENALLLFDPDHSDEEERYVLIGMSLTTRLIVVCHCVREKGCVIRIITARKATRREWNQYWVRLKQ